MVIIKPFRGIRYSPEKIADLSTVVSQPHDRISAYLQDRYYDLSPFNITRIIKGKESPQDGKTDNVYTRAQDTYQAWLREGVLAEEQTPALYLTQQTFTLPDGSTKTRRGLMAALELSRYDEGIVLPHERIIPKSMVDRLELVRVTEANFGSIFMLYPGGGINQLLQSIVEQQAPFEFRDLFEPEVLQRLWVVTDPEVIATAQETMAAKPHLIIADGHHRYETALNYQAEMRAKYPDAPKNAGFNYRLVTLVSMDDPGLTILPTHRLIDTSRRINPAEALEKAKTYFEIRAVSDRAALEAALETTKKEALPSFGFYDGTFAVLTLRNAEVMAHLLPNHSADWRLLDVSVVHELFIERILGIDKQAVANEEHVAFIRDANEGYEAVTQGKADYLLLMNPTRIEQVRACTTTGERMPQKSTDFYPKMLNGLVMLPVRAEDRL